jgi:hypothetical protein
MTNTFNELRNELTILTREKEKIELQIDSLMVKMQGYLEASQASLQDGQAN